MNYTKKLMLATDFDGTLCCEGVIETSVKSAMSEFREKGNLFGIVTGRCADCSFDFLKDHRDITVDFVISNNGARAFDSDGNTLFSKKDRCTS